jgi:GNAT superfamily N-acetyltransferase
MKIEIYEKNEIGDFEGCSKSISDWANLWYEDLEEAGVEHCFVAFDEDTPIAFQTVNLDGFCVAIEVHSDYQGKGIALELIKESGANKPERNENTEFWESINNKLQN